MMTLMNFSLSLTLSDRFMSHQLNQQKQDPLSESGEPQHLHHNQMGCRDVSLQLPRLEVSHQSSN